MNHDLITIEGSRTTKSTALEPGARLRVVRTAYIEALIRGGFVNVIETEPTYAEPVLTPEQTEAVERVLLTVEDHDVIETKTFGGETVTVDIVPTPDETDDEDDEPYVVPALNASRPTWAAFLAERSVPYPAKAKRDDLIELWTVHNGG